MEYDDREMQTYSEKEERIGTFFSLKGDFIHPSLTRITHGVQCTEEKKKVVGRTTESTAPSPNTRK
jgi:hypothetical protein